MEGGGVWLIACAPMVAGTPARNVAPGGWFAGQGFNRAAVEGAYAGASQSIAAAAPSAPGRSAERKGWRTSLANLAMRLAVANSHAPAQRKGLRPTVAGLRKSAKKWPARRARPNADEETVAEWKACLAWRAPALARSVHIRQEKNRWVAGSLSRLAITLQERAYSNSRWTPPRGPSIRRFGARPRQWTVKFSGLCTAAAAKRSNPLGPAARGGQ